MVATSRGPRATDVVDVELTRPPTQPSRVVAGTAAAGTAAAAAAVATWGTAHSAGVTSAAARGLVESGFGLTVLGGSSLDGGGWGTGVVRFGR